MKTAVFYDTSVLSTSAVSLRTMSRVRCKSLWAECRLFFCKWHDLLGSVIHFVVTLCERARYPHLPGAAQPPFKKDLVDNLANSLPAILKDGSRRRAQTQAAGDRESRALKPDISACGPHIKRQPERRSTMSEIVNLSDSLPTIGIPISHQVEVPYNCNKGKHKKPKWYAVALGRAVGVFRTELEAKWLVDEFSDACVRSFKSEFKCRDWMQELHHLDASAHRQNTQFLCLDNQGHDVYQCLCCTEIFCRNGY